MALPTAPEPYVGAPRIVWLVLESAVVRREMPKIVSNRSGVPAPLAARGIRKLEADVPGGSPDAYERVAGRWPLLMKIVHSCKASAPEVSRWA